MATPIEGRNGRFQVFGANANVESFNGELSTDRVEATGFEDQSPITLRCPQVVITGLDKCTANVKGYVDADAMPSSFGFTQGFTLSDVRLFLVKGSPTKQIFMPAAVIFKINYQAQVKDKIMFDMNIESTGMGLQLLFTNPS